MSSPPLDLDAHRKQAFDAFKARFAEGTLTYEDRSGGSESSDWSFVAMRKEEEKIVIIGGETYSPPPDLAKLYTFPPAATGLRGASEDRLPEWIPPMSYEVLKEVIAPLLQINNSKVLSMSSPASQDFDFLCKPIQIERREDPYHMAIMKPWRDHKGSVRWKWTGDPEFDAKCKQAKDAFTAKFPIETTALHTSWRNEEESIEGKKVTGYWEFTAYSVPVNENCGSKLIGSERYYPSPPPHSFRPQFSSGQMILDDDKPLVRSPEHNELSTAAMADKATEPDSEPTQE